MLHALALSLSRKIVSVITSVVIFFFSLVFSHLVDPMTVCDSLAKDLCCLCCMVVFFGGLLETKTSANANYAKFDCFIGYLLLLLLGGW